jgi:hypothetical protein
VDDEVPVILRKREHDWGRADRWRNGGRNVEMGVGRRAGAGTFVFRIGVIDHGASGTNDSYGIMLSDGYFSGQHQLQGGNVTIHK